MTRASAHHRGYGAKWRTARLAFLADNPLCVYCAKEGRVCEATVVDHIKPHKGDAKLFWSRANWQALCKLCHDRIKQRIERGGEYRSAIGEDGWPISE